MACCAITVKKVSLTALMPPKSSVTLQLAQAAVRHQLGAQEERRLVGGQKHRGVGDLVRIAEAPEGNVLPDAGRELVERFGAETQPAEDRSSHGAGTDHVYTNSAVHEVGRERAGEGPERSLAGGIDAVIGHPQQPRDRAIEDDGRAASEQWQRLLDRE